MIKNPQTPDRVLLSINRIACICPAPNFERVRNPVKGLLKIAPILKTRYKSKIVSITGSLFIANCQKIKCYSKNIHKPLTGFC
jgi:hypothetical protein